MRNFRINPEGFQEPEVEPHFYSIGTKLIFAVDQFKESVAESLTVRVMPQGVL